MNKNENAKKFENVKVTRIVYSNPDKNYYVFIGQINSTKTKEKFVTHCPIAIGEKWDIIGNETVYSGNQQISVIKQTKNTSMDLDELKSYLITFNGIGQAKAKKILDSFGTDVFNVLKNDYLKLVSIGIPEQIAHEMHCFVTENEEFNKLISLLSPYNISINSARKIYNRYKDRSAEVLLNNPYKVMEQLGLSYELIDLFAIHNNISTLDTTRIIGGIKEAMKRYSNMGNTFAYVADICEQTKKILNNKVTDPKLQVCNSDIIKVLVYMSEETKELIINSETSCFLPNLYYTERNISRKLLRMISKKRKNFDCDFNTVIKEIEEEIGFPYSDNQRDAIITSLNNKMHILTGGPGTGKTTTVNGIIRAFKKCWEDVNIVLAAPTGAAAKRMENATGMAAKTIHRLLEYKPFDGQLTCERNEENPIEADVLIIDESSMADLELLNLLLKALSDNTILILVGDIDQLPSVGPGNVLKDLINSRCIPVTVLETVYRQKGESTIIANSKRMKDGLDIELDKDDFRLIETLPDDSVIAKLIVDRYCNLLNSGYSTDDVQILCPMRKRENKVSSTVINAMIQHEVNPHSDNKAEVVFGSKIFRVGDKVIQLKNNYEKSCFNGDIGYIVSITQGQDAVVTVKFDEEREISFEGREEIFELDLAYAMSVHKSQGSEYKKVLAPMTMTNKRLLTKNLFYTLFTRAKESVEFYGTLEAVNYAVHNVETTKRLTKLMTYIQNTFKKISA